MKRNNGIDLLKIIMMFLIVCGHVIWHGGIWDNVVIKDPLALNSVSVIYLYIYR